MNFTCNQNYFHSGASFIPGWDFISATRKQTLSISLVNMNLRKKAKSLRKSLKENSFLEKTNFLLVTSYYLLVSSYDLLSFSSYYLIFYFDSSRLNRTAPWRSDCHYYLTLFKKAWTLNSVQVQVLLVACRKFATVRTYVNDPG